MIRHLACACSLGFALGSWLALGAPRAYASSPAETAGDTQDLFFLGGGHPILVRFHIEINGMPLSAAWREAVVKLHTHLDFNSDGILRREEAERVEWPRLIRLFGNPVRSPAPMANRTPAQQVATLPALDVRPQDGVVSVEELSEFLRAVRGPLSIQTRPPSDSDQDTTFERIDADGDKTLSAVERAQAANLLKRYDQNDDESLSSVELATFQNPMFGNGAMQERGGTEPPLFLLDPSASRIRMVQQLLNRLDIGGTDGAKAKDHRLSRTEIGLTAEVFGEFDNDGDLTLDSDELMQYLGRGEPSLEIIVRLGTRSIQRSVVEFIDRQLMANGKPGLGASMKPYDLEVVERPGHAVMNAPRVRVRNGDETIVTIKLGDVWVDLSTENTMGDAAGARQYYDSVFQNLDADKSNSLSLSEVKGREPFQGLFRLIDKNGDGQVGKEELNAALTLLEDLSHRQSLVAVADRGVLLFGNLDTNGDDRLGLRELRTASALLASFDRNGDGQVAAAEIPHRFEWFFSQAPIPLGYVIRGNRREMIAAQERVATDGPPWFQKMDRNRDGDLSPREFLGPRAEFQRLDADADGLIDAQEATKHQNSSIK